MNLLNHLVISGKGSRTKYRPLNSFGRPPRRNRFEHGNRILEQFKNATARGVDWLERRAEWLAQQDVTAISFSEGGFYLELIATRFDPSTFESAAAGIEVVAAVPLSGNQTRVTLYVPGSARGYFQEIIDRYLDERLDTKSGPSGSQTVDRIDQVRFDDPIALLWTDTTRTIPEHGEIAWWEIWIRDELNHEFLYAIRNVPVGYKDAHLRFPERQVWYLRATRDQIESIIRITSAVAELRRAMDTPTGILAAPNGRQADLVQNILKRTIAPDSDAPAICLLDTGVNVNHPLLAVASSEEETWSYLDAWGKHDGAIHGHGTAVAGLGLYGDIASLAMSDDDVVLTHRIESVKVVPDDNEDPPDADIYGLIYRESMLKPWFDFPHRRRVYCTAITNNIESDRGLPTAWSGAIDAACADKADRKLLVISAGNVDVDGSVIYANEYPSKNEVNGILDPAQSWNALTVGAYTVKQHITEARYAGYVPVAPVGGLCPQSRTALLWGKDWPIKPDVVFEGGNHAYEPGQQYAYSIDDLGVVSLYHEPQAAMFASFGFTSGASGLASNMCATIMAKYPDLWPETIRALVAHSAEYTPEMLSYYNAKNEGARRNLVARFGHGVPNLQRALHSLQNDLTMIVQGAIQPFYAQELDTVNNEIIYYRLPWPTDVLRANYGSSVRLKVTLSYFVEPNPSRRGFKGKYSYPSHGLRFAVQRPLEPYSQFVQRVNALERSDGYASAGPDDGWFLKKRVRDRGCLISDSWEGDASELVDRSTVAVYPVGGWWKSMKRASREDRNARFSLCVSLLIHDAEVDLYTPVKVALENMLTA